MIQILILLSSIHYFDVGLTYDDGPTNESHKLIEYLRDEKITAMFFPTGLNLQWDENYLSELLIKKQEVGNHTYSHLELDKAPIKKIDAEFTRQHEILVRAGFSVKFFRYPSGKPSKRLKYLLKKYNYDGIADWDVATGDIFKKTDDQIIYLIDRAINKKLLKQNFDLIILFHDCSAGVLRRTRKLVQFIKIKNLNSSLMDKGVVFYQLSSPAEIFKRRLVE